MPTHEIPSPRAYMLAPLFLLIFAGALFAQTNTAAISGLVTDPSGSVIANAGVVVVNTDTNVSQSTLTNQAGIYSFPTLQPGPHRLTIKHPGFKEIVQQGLVLHVQDAISLNFRMELGATTESVTVTATAAALNTEDATVGTVIERQFVEHAPLNGRSFQGLVTLTPGVASVTANGASTGQFAVNGQRTDTSYFMVDGVRPNVASPMAGSLSSNGTGSTPTNSATGVSTPSSAPAARAISSSP